MSLSIEEFTEHLSQVHGIDIADVLRDPAPTIIEDTASKDVFLRLTLLKRNELGRPFLDDKGEPASEVAYIPMWSETRLVMSDEQFIDYLDEACSTNFDRVHEWMRLAQPDKVQHMLTVPDQATQVLRMALIEEELTELRQGYINGDLVEIADAVADLLYVVYGAAVECGFDADAVFEEVHDSNMTKIPEDGQVLRREDGKTLKPPGYRPPDIKAALDRSSFLNSLS